MQLLASITAAVTLAAPFNTTSTTRGLCTSCWIRVARCESTLRWHLRGPGPYEGGLQFVRSTWLAFGGGRFASHAYLASPWQQMVVADTVRVRSGLHNWPVCGRHWWG